jgi:hypothetical protein
VFTVEIQLIIDSCSANGKLYLYIQENLFLVDVQLLSLDVRLLTEREIRKRSNNEQKNTQRIFFIFKFFVAVASER